ncbi:MAG: TonB-dependent receptor [Bryobacteraceae bacterium]
MRGPARSPAFLILCFTSSVALYAQSSGGNSGTVHGTILDPSGAAVPGATVELQNPVSRYDKSTKSDSQGNFEFANIPYNNYHLSATAAGFQGGEQDVNVRSSLPIDVKVAMTLGAANSTVTVTEAADLLETDSTAHTDVDRELFDKLPLESASSALSSLVTLSTPGVSGDSNGLMHGLGDHASNSFSVDGEPITDQQSKVFSNQIPMDSVQSMEVIEGAPPAEYGGKTSLVVVVTTRSGLGVNQPHGDVTASYGTFGSSDGAFDLAYGQEKWGNFISVGGLDTGRFLDGPEYQVFHDHGNEENAFDRLDFKPSDADSININLGFTRSWFQTPNSYDAQNATAWSGLIVNNGGLGPNGLPVGSADQRSQIRTFNIAPTWTRLLNPNSVFTFGAFVRQDQFNYYPSANPFADLTPDLQLASDARPGGSNRKRPLFERQRKSRYQPQPDESEQLWGSAAAESKLHSAACVLRPHTDIAASIVRRLPELHQRRICILWSCRHQGICSLHPGRNHPQKLDLQPRSALR